MSLCLTSRRADSIQFLLRVLLMSCGTLRTIRFSYSRHCLHPSAKVRFPLAELNLNSECFLLLSSKLYDAFDRVLVLPHGRALYSGQGGLPPAEYFASQGIAAQGFRGVGGLYFKTSETIAGFQSRVGCLFFLVTQSLSSHSCSLTRLIFRVHLSCSLH